MSINDAVIISTARTPIGCFRGSLSSLSAPQLGAFAIKEAIKRAGLHENDIQELFMGCALQGNIGQAPARQAGLKAGLLESTPCTTVNKVCASGMKAIIFAAQTLMLGNQDICVAGGMESMSNCPYYLERGDMRYGGMELKDALVVDGLTDAFGGGHMGECTEYIAEKYKLTRKDQDEYAIASYKKTITAAEAGLLEKEIIPVEIIGKKGAKTIVSSDEEYKRVNFEKLLTLSPAFQKEGTITAANASSLSDGAAACVMTTHSIAQKLGIKPLAKILAFADAAVNPKEFSTAPAYAIPKKAIQDCTLQQNDSMQYLPLPVSLGKQDTASGPSQDGNYLSYTQYLSTVKGQVNFAKSVQEMLTDGARKITQVD